MTSLQDLADKLVAFVLLPATIYGAGGGILRAFKSGKRGAQIALEGASGAFVAHMCGPLITAYVPEPWQYPCVFLSGWGGLELVSRAYTLATEWVVARIRATMPHTPEHDDVRPDPREGE